MKAMNHAARWISGAVAALALVVSANAAPVTLYDGKIVVSVVYDKAGGTPIAKAAELLARDLAALTGRSDLAEAARQGVAAESVLLERAPEACTSLLVAASELAGPPRELVVVGEPRWPSTRALLRATRRAPRPPTVIAPAPAVPVPAAVVARVPLFTGRERTDEGRALAYLCEGGTCRLPVDDPVALARALAADR